MGGPRKFVRCKMYQHAKITKSLEYKIMLCSFIYVVRHNHLFRLASLYGNQSSKAYVLNENTQSTLPGPRAGT